MPNAASPPLAASRDLPAVRAITVADLKDAVARGIEDFRARPTHVIFLALIYPVVGLLLARMTSDAQLMPLFFPVAAGFALLGPFAALGLYELSRRRERGEDPSWSDALGVLRAPSILALAELGLALAAIFVAWLFAAQWIAGAMIAQAMGDAATMSSYGAFLSAIVSTPAGWALIVAGNLAGLCFALAAFAISVVSFPFLLDHDASVGTAVATSLRAVAKNPLVLGLWGLFVALVLAAASLPLFIGLAVAMPILGHATWHLYRKVVA